MHPKVQRQQGRGCFRQGGRDSISTFVEIGVGMWEKMKYLRAGPFQESPRRLVWLEPLGEMIAVV